MVIKKEWSVLIIGDGDLSFSRSIFNHYQPKKLTATVLDSESELISKYGSENLRFLQQHALIQDRTDQDTRQCEVLTEFDVTNVETIKQLTKCYDLLIFQFPLVPNFSNQQQFKQQTQQDDLVLSVNTLNRRLLRVFLMHGFEYLLSESGAQLAYISSKDVKPYTEWDIEYSLTQGFRDKVIRLACTETKGITCFGSIPFVIDQFPGYKIRNVDRDKHVKDTAATTYVWTLANKIKNVSHLFSNLTLPTELFGENGCDVCHAGPFTTAAEKYSHIAGKKHIRMSGYEIQWQRYLESENK